MVMTQMALTRLTTPLCQSVLVLSLCVFISEAYFADWSVLGGRPHEPTCVDIPPNMTLCSDVGYEKMRLPNLLDHDTLTEVQQQSGSWVPLLNVQCHPHTKLFLCSLFTPVCLESQIFPCRSLCTSVQRSCELRMRTYGYHWPDMLRCDKFPLDNDMCIKAPIQDIQSQNLSNGSGCDICHPVETLENILDHFCQSDVVLRARIKHENGNRVSLRKVKLFKADGAKKALRRGVKLLLKDESDCCKMHPGKEKFLIMGVKSKDNFLIPTFVLPWKKSKIIRQAVKMFRKVNCEDPNLFKSSAEDGAPVMPRTNGGKLVKGKGEKKKQSKTKKNKKERNKDRNKKERE